jgi:two-component system sensor histidine kinase RpfC
VRQLRVADDAARPPIVDTSALDALRALGDGGSFLRMLADDFLADSAATVDRIAEAAAAHDARGVRDGAHALRSSAAHLGARRLHRVCVSVGGVTDGDLSVKGDAFVAELRREFDLLRAELTRLLDPAPAAVAGE